MCSKTGSPGRQKWAHLIRPNKEFSVRVFNFFPSMVIHMSYGQQFVFSTVSQTPPRPPWRFMLRPEHKPTRKKLHACQGRALILRNHPPLLRKWINVTAIHSSVWKFKSVIFLCWKKKEIIPDNCSYQWAFFSPDLVLNDYRSWLSKVISDELRHIIDEFVRNKELANFWSSTFNLDVKPRAPLTLSVHCDWDPLADSWLTVL